MCNDQTGRAAASALIDQIVAILRAFLTLPAKNLKELP